MKQYSSDKDIERLIHFFDEQCTQRIPWIQRKEFAAWSATILYVGIFLSFLSQPITKSENLLNRLDESSIWLFFIAVIILGFIFFRFIHSQYSSIYGFTSHTEVLEELTLELIELKEDFFKKYNVKNKQNLNELIERRKKSQRNKVQQFCGRGHPAQILFRFCTYFIIKVWFYFLNKARRSLASILKKPEVKDKHPRKLTNFEKEESATYFLLIIITFFFEYFIYKICT